MVFTFEFRTELMLALSAVGAPCRYMNLSNRGYFPRNWLH
jgi:hypothetical protein